MNNDYLTLEIIANNHPGVMSHVTGLFSRRGFNIEGIHCGPLANKELSKILILLRQDRFSIQIIKQLEKLYDVQEVSRLEGFDNSLFFT